MNSIVDCYFSVALPVVKIEIKSEVADSAIELESFVDLISDDEEIVECTSGD